MPTIEKMGFLSKEIELYIEKHRKENAPWFGLSEECNQLGQEVLYAIEISRGDLQRMLVALWFSRALTHFQAIVVLTERGMLYEAQIILRTLIEVLFSLVSLAKNHEMGQEFLKDDKVQQLKMLNTYRNLPKNLKEITEEQKSHLDDLVENLKCEICKNKYKELKTTEIAHKAGMSDFYNTIYAILCSTVHARIRDLESQLLLDSDQEVKQLNWGPDTSGLDNVLLAANESLLISIDQVNALFDLNFGERLALLHSKFKQIGDKT